MAETVGNGRAVAVGVGVPSVVEFATGRARSSVNVPLQDVPLRDLLRERLGVPVFVDNDGNCAALAEAHEGDRLVARELVMFTVGTGVGGGLVLGGRPYRGATGGAGELGHMIIGADLGRGAPRRARRFPQPGSLEALARGGTLDDMAATVAHQRPRSALGRAAAHGEEVTGRDAVVAAQEGDEDSVRLLRLIGERLGIGIANAINTFDPEVVAVGGGVSTAGELLLGPAREAASRFVLPGVGEGTEVRLARHGGRAGLVGAALLAGQELAVAEAVG
jgi:glucokinase